jgi:DNA-binding transcriptional LysR family regulator
VKKNKEFNFDLKQIRSFLEIIQENSFTKASRKLKIGQATISHHINLLEEMLGVVLMERSSKTFSVTPEGKIFKKFAESLFSDVENLKRDMSRGGFGGVTKIAASTISSTYILPDVVASLKKEDPELYFSIEAADSREAIEMIKEGKVELGIVGKMLKHPSLNYYHIFSDEIVLIGGKNSPASISLQELPHMPLIQRENGSGTRDAAEKCLNGHDIAPSDLSVVYECSTSEGVKEAVISGIGIAFISRLAIQRELQLKSLRIIGLNGITINRDFYAVHVKNRHLTEAGRKLLGELKKLK